MTTPTTHHSVRIDKFLWAARFFKTRTLAARACDLGRIQSNRQPAKPSREVHVGDQLHIANDGGDFDIEVLALSETRGPPPSPKLFTAKPRPAAPCAKKSPLNAAPPATSKSSRLAAPPNATAATSSNSADAPNLFPELMILFLDHRGMATISPVQGLQQFRNLRRHPDHPMAPECVDLTPTFASRQETRPIPFNNLAPSNPPTDR